MIRKTLVRLLLVPIGFILSLVASGFVLVTLGMERVTHAVHGRDVDWTAMPQLWALLKDFGSLAQVSTLALPLLLVIVGEVSRIRSSTYYIVGGGASLALLPLLVRTTAPGDGLSQLGLVWQVFATAGFVGGFVYWLIAGRSA